MRKTIQDLNAMKAKRDKIIALTAYDYQTAEILDEICDLILVGDSLGNVFQGKETTLSVTLDEIIYHAKAVDKALSNAHFCVDMPFMSYQQSTSSALENIGKVFKGFWRPHFLDAPFPNFNFCGCFHFIYSTYHLPSCIFSGASCKPEESNADVINFVDSILGRRDCSYLCDHDFARKYRCFKSCSEVAGVD